MDPRHPELAISRIDELIAQYKKIIRTMQTEATSNEVAKLEREGSLVIQEICLVAPRLHEAMMQVSRTRRGAIARGLVEVPVEATPPTQAETIIVEPKPRKKKTTKKKKAE